MVELEGVSTTVTGFWGWVGGGGLAALIMTVVRLRRTFSRDEVDRRKDSAEKNMIDRLSEQLDKADSRAEAADRRAEVMFDQRQHILNELAPIRTTMALMEDRLRQQADTMTAQRQEIERLRAANADQTRKEA